MRRTNDVEILSTVFSARINVIDALLRSQEANDLDGSTMRETAKDLTVASHLMEQATAAGSYAALAELCLIVATLLDWRKAVLAAEVDADRFLRSAKERYSIWNDGSAKSPADAFVSSLRSATARISEINAIGDVVTVCKALASTPLPLPIIFKPSNQRWAIRGQESVEKEKLGKLAVAYVKFMIDGMPANEIHYLSPGEAHDLDIEVRVSRWPEKAERLVLKPITVELPDTYSLPPFSFDKPSGDPPFALNQRGRAVIRTPQYLGARPFEFKYSAEFLPLTSEQPLEVVGQRTLRLEGIDIRANPISGYPAVDRRLIGIRDELRRTAGLRSDDLSNALVVLFALSNVAGQTVQDDLFRDKITEGQFQKEIRRVLRTMPTIGAELEEHPHAGGGITDLSFRGIRIELKVEPDSTLQLKDCARFVEQTASYVVATGKKIGVLCVLDCSVKASPPFPVEDGIGILPCNYKTSQVSVATVLLQGNLAKPSQFSR